MALSERLALKLQKKFEPSAMINLRFGRLDAAVKTDSEGNAVLLFLGKRNRDGEIIGDRYARTLKSDERGVIIKDHWERKGNAS
jgi:hypothetical protein